MRNLLQESFHPPDIAGREAPVVIPKVIKVGDPVAGDAPGLIDIGVEVAHHKVAHRSEDGLAPVEADVPRPGYGSILPALPEEKKHVIEQILGLDADEERRVPVLFQYHGCGQSRFQAVRFFFFNDPTKRTTRGSFGLPVVREGSEKALDLRWRLQRTD